MLSRQLKEWLVVVVAGLAVLVPAPLWGQEIPAETLKEIKAATVYVKVEFQVVGQAQTLPGTGSGFVVRVDGGTVYIATNNHVINTPKNLPQIRRRGLPTVVFHSGTSKEKSFQAEVLAADAINDLAILRLKDFKDAPKVIVVNPKVEPTETMGVFIFGFPFGQQLSVTKGNPAITIAKGAISSIREDEEGKVKVLQIDGDLNPGNSGGPVVDAKGQLIGVAVAKVDKTRIGMAIPAAKLAAIFAGSVVAADFRPLKIDKGQAEMRLSVHVVDPLNKVKEVVLYHAKNAKLKDLKPDADGNWALLPNAASLDLRREGDRAVGTLAVTGKEKTRLPIAIQTLHVGADGKKVYSKPAEFTIDFNMTALSGSLAEQDPKYRNGQPHKAHAIKLEGGKTYVVQMLAQSDNIDPYLFLEDAEGNVLAQDDDGGGFPNARIVYKPSKSGTYVAVATAFVEKGAFKGTGAYVLTYEENAKAILGTKVFEVAKDGLKIDDKLALADPPDVFLAQQAKKKSPHRVYQVRLNAGQKYVIELSSKDFDSVLRVEAGVNQQLALDDDGGGGLNSRLVFMPPSTGVYRIIATCLDEVPGQFTLSVRRE